MTVVSSTEFKNHQDKYLELAINEQVFIKKGNNMFTITTANSYDEPDEDAALLALAKSRMIEEEDDELITADELINYLRK